MLTVAAMLLALAMQTLGVMVVPALSSDGSTSVQHVRRVPNRCDFVLSKGVRVTPGTLRSNTLHFYDSWNFTTPKQDEGAELARGQKVWVSNVTTHGLTCIATATQAGWIPSSQVTRLSHVARRQLNPGDFVGAWRRGEYTKIVIVSTNNGGLSVEAARADCDPAGASQMVCSHYLRAKDMTGTRIRNDMWDFKATKRVPRSPAMRKAGLKPSPCEIHVRRIGQALYVRQMGSWLSLCGAEGSFNGVYHRDTSDE